MTAMIERYIKNTMHHVPGYFTQADARIWQALLACQSEAGITGNLAEIGLYFGRSFFLLEQFRAPGEKLWGCDLFTVTDHIAEHPDQKTAFEYHARRNGINLEEIVVETADTGSIDTAAFAGKMAPVRFFSIDGGHQLEHLRNDSALAHSVLHEDGIIAFDDFCAPRYPEVTEGILEFLSAHEEFMIFAISRKKAYAARKLAAENYIKAIRNAPALRNARFEEMHYRGADIPFINEHYRTILFQKANDIAKRGLLPVL